MKLFRIRLGTGRARSTARRTSGYPGSFRTAWRTLRQTLSRIELVRLKAPQHPFFTTLHELLDRHPSITLGQLLEEAGEQVWGFTILLLAMFTFIPGVANLLSLVTLLAGIGMMIGADHPWLPAKLQRMELHHGRIKAMLATVESHLGWLARRHRVRRAPSQWFTGFLVAWTALIAALPIPIPFANTLPAIALILFGVAMLEEWPSLGWYGAAISLGTTIYFAFSIRQILIMFAEMWGWITHWLRPGLF